MYAPVNTPQRTSSSLLISRCGEKKKPADCTLSITAGPHLRTNPAKPPALICPPVALIFHLLIPSACFSPLQAAFNKVQPAPPERTPAKSQPNTGKCLQTQVKHSLMRGKIDKCDQTGEKEGKNALGLK